MEISGETASVKIGGGCEFMYISLLSVVKERTLIKRKEEEKNEEGCSIRQSMPES
jgi:hypothetical protein